MFSLFRFSPLSPHFPRIFPSLGKGAVKRAHFKLLTCRRRREAEGAWPRAVAGELPSAIYGRITGTLTSPATPAAASPPTCWWAICQSMNDWQLALFLFFFSLSLSQSRKHLSILYAALEFFFVFSFFFWFFVQQSKRNKNGEKGKCVQSGVKCQSCSNQPWKTHRYTDADFRKVRNSQSSFCEAKEEATFFRRQQSASH